MAATEDQSSGTYGFAPHVYSVDSGLLARVDTAYDISTCLRAGIIPEGEARLDEFYEAEALVLHADDTVRHSAYALDDTGSTYVLDGKVYIGTPLPPIRWNPGQQHISFQFNQLPDNAGPQPIKINRPGIYKFRFWIKRQFGPNNAYKEYAAVFDSLNFEVFEVSQPQDGNQQ